MRTASATRTFPLLQAATVLVAGAVLAFLLWEPNVEGVNANAASLSDVYFDDPFLSYVYVGSIPFFVAVYQAFLLFGNAAGDAAKRLRTIRTCAFALMAFIAVAEAWLFVVVRPIEEDVAGGVAMGVFAMLVAIGIAACATAFERSARGPAN